MKKYGELEEKAKGSGLAQCRLFALYVWTWYVSCVTMMIPTIFPNNDVDPSLVQDALQRARYFLGVLADSTMYAHTKLQLATALLLRRGAEEVCFRALESAGDPGKWRSDMESGDVGRPPNLNMMNVFGNIQSSPIQFGDLVSMIQTQGGRLAMGDYINAGSGSTIVNRSAVMNSFNQASDPVFVESLRKIAEIVDSTGDPDGADIAEAFIVEATGQQRRALLKTLWGRLREIAPPVAAVLTTGTKLYDLLQG